MSKNDTILDADLTYKDPTWLNYQLNTLKKSKCQVAKECGVTHSMICYWTGGKKTKQEYRVKNKDIIRDKKKNMRSKTQII
jgi:hypothetical protein